MPGALPERGGGVGGEIRAVNGIRLTLRGRKENAE